MGDEHAASLTAGADRIGAGAHFTSPVLASSRNLGERGRIDALLRPGDAAAEQSSSSSSGVGLRQIYTLPASCATTNPRHRRPHRRPQPLRQQAAPAER
jgi:hypothetical protein